MKGIIKTMFDYLTLKGLPIGSKIVVYWFILSLLLLLCIGEGTPFPVLMGLLINFAASVLAMHRTVSPNDFGEDE